MANDAYIQFVESLGLAHKEETPWTKEEHNSFIKGFLKYNHNGPMKCWKKISKKYVPTKNLKEVQLHGEKLLDNHKPKPICTPSNRNRRPPTFPPSPPSSDDDDDGHHGQQASGSGLASSKEENAEES